MSATYPAPAASENASAVMVDVLAEYLITRIQKDTAHPEYKIFEGQLGLPKVPLGPPNAPGLSGIRMQWNVWDLINDAIDACGGFSDGSYLVPHELELDGTAAGGFARKFLERMQIARYDNFAKIIGDGPWNSIIAMKDMIVRDAEAHPRLEAFWDDVDGNGTNIEDFLEYPVSQAWRFGTGWIFLDRPAGIKNLKDDLAAPPWAFCVPTRNVVWWQYNRTGAITAVAYRDPSDEEDAGVDKTLNCPIVIVTAFSWSRWTRPSSDVAYTQQYNRPHQFGRVPCIQLFAEYPGARKGFGKSNMLSTARFALDCYNRDSEIREIERRTAFPMLHVSIDDLSQASQIVVGTNGVLATDGKVAPSWLEPALNSIEKLAAERKNAKDAAFVMSEMTGLLGHTNDIQTSSGYHSEVELDKSERRVGSLAASVETAENKIAKLFLVMIGEEDEEYGVSYPRKFGLINLDAMVARTKERLALNLGPEDTVEVLKDYYNAVYPRKTAKEIEEMAKKGGAYRAANPASAFPFAGQQPGQPAAPVAATPAALTARQRLGLPAKGQEAA